MPDPVCESISKNIKTTLEGITTGAGYNMTVQSVQRYLQSGQVTLAVPAVLIRDGGETVTEGPAAGDYSLVACRRSYHLLLLHRIDEATETRSGDEIMNLFTADVQQAMLAAPRRGEYATDTREVGSEPVESEDGVPDLMRILEFEVHYRRRRDDPTAKS